VHLVPECSRRIDGDPRNLTVVEVDPGIRKLSSQQLRPRSLHLIQALTSTRFLGLLVLGACASAVSSSGNQSSSGVETRLVQSDYQVHGSNEDELLRALLGRGPTVGNLPVFASTAWEVRWRFQPRRRAGQCEIERISVTLNITTRLPHWVAPANASQQIRSDWAAFVAALAVHEKGHTQLGTLAADSVLRVLGTHRNARGYSCDGLVSDAHAAAEATLQHYHEKNIRYDLDTSHGAAQGVRWPRVRLDKIEVKEVGAQTTLRFGARR
jgi:predicted secreted Zn-dependent protease